MTEIREVFFSEGVCPNLHELSLSFCKELREIGGLCSLSKLRKLDIQGCKQLRELDIHGCKQLEELSSLETLVSLEVINATWCETLKSIQGLGRLTKLRTLKVDYCKAIQQLPGVEHLMSLEQLNACNCPKLHWGQGLVEQLRQQLKGKIPM